jgi:hypothetical protein
VQGLTLVLRPQDLPIAHLTGNKFPASLHIRQMLLPVALLLSPIVRASHASDAEYEQATRRHPTRATHPQSHQIICNALHALSSVNTFDRWSKGPRHDDHLHFRQTVGIAPKPACSGCNDSRGTLWFTEHRSRNTAEYCLLPITIFQVLKLSFHLQSSI